MKYLSKCNKIIIHPKIKQKVKHKQFQNPGTTKHSMKSSDVLFRLF